MSFSDKSPISVKAATRKALRLMVEHEERKVKSRDVAYINVAEQVMRSPSWVKKAALSDDFMRDPHPILFRNIRSAYVRLCEHIEQEHRAEVQKLAAIKGEINALAVGSMESTGRAAQASTRRTNVSTHAPAEGVLNDNQPNMRKRRQLTVVA